MRQTSTKRIAPLVTRLRIVVDRFIRETEGATMIEYSLVTAMMAACVVACMTLFGKAMGDMFDSIVKYYTLAQ